MEKTLFDAAIVFGLGFTIWHCVLRYDPTQSMAAAVTLLAGYLAGLLLTHGTRR